jgi:hypothetical protein
MPKHILGSLKLSGGILSIYCLSLAIVPTAHAETNVSTGGGMQTASMNRPPAPLSISIQPNSISNPPGNSGPGIAPAVTPGGSPFVGRGSATPGSVATGNAGDIATANEKGRTIFGTNPQANIRATQAIQARLDAAQSAVDSTSARLSQLLAASPTPQASDNSKLSAIRYALKPTAPGDCGCNNPDVTTKPADNSAELAAAREAQSKAATELAEAQDQARQFLVSAQKVAEVSQNNAYSPVW